MNLDHVTTSDVAAQDTCALSGPLPFAGMGTLSAQPGFRPVRRRDLMAAVNTVGRDLGLRPASIVVLDALLSCLPCKSAETGTESTITPATLLTVFASNATLCYRARGITDRQLRRHLLRLEEVGLIRRRDSANGKRFPVYRGGKVVGAFGLDLTPLLVRAQELRDLAERRRNEAAELRGLKAHIQSLRAQCLHLDLDDTAVQMVEATRNLMRRATATVVQARAIVRELTRMLTGGSRGPEDDADVPAMPRLDDAVDTPEAVAETRETPATDGQNVRHKESEKPYTKKSCARLQPRFWERLASVPEFYPHPPTSEQGLRRVLYDFGKMLGIGHGAVTMAIGRLGAIGTLQVQDQMAQRITTIADPERYLARALDRAVKPGVGHGQHLPCR
ncbi:MAG: replication protein C [Rhodobacteraceae bacterium]|nr:MAG: replication protein C [Paracoccaceae bacterium]